MTVAFLRAMPFRRPADGRLPSAVWQHCFFCNGFGQKRRLKIDEFSASTVESQPRLFFSFCSGATIMGMQFDIKGLDLTKDLKGKTKVFEFAPMPISVTIDVDADKKFDSLMHNKLVE